MKPPDFRIVTDDGEQLLVEVKNCRPKRQMNPFRMRAKDLEALKRYAALVGIDNLKLAIYWSWWNLWTLVDPDSLLPSGSSHLAVELPEAMKANHMGSLGDRIIGTDWPLGMVLYSDPAKKSRLDNNEVEFTIDRVDFTVAGQTVHRPEEQEFVFRLILHGGWNEHEPVASQEGDVIAVRVLFSPEEEPDGGARPALHDPLSSIYSSMFNQATMDQDGEITGVRIKIDPGALGALIPDDYEGETLHIWRLHQQPA